MTTTTSNDVLQVTRDARGVVTLTLNDPARFNALGGEMLTALQQVLGYPTDVGLAAASVITGGLLQRLPGLRIAFSHGGGTLAALLPRCTVTPGLAGSSTAGSDTATPLIRPWVSCSAAAMAAPPPLEMPPYSQINFRMES